jgi:hypothetical protein
MTRKIILSVMLTVALVANFSFAPSPSAKPISTSTVDRKFIIVCLYTGGCRHCGGVQWTPTSTTICASSVCPGQGSSICITFASRINPVSKKYEVDDTSITVDYSDPAVKAATDEAALKADLIEQVNAQL